MKKILIATALFSSLFFFAQKSENYLQVGYASVCCGTPSDKPVMDYIRSFQQKHKIRSLEVYKQSGLGREGEYNLYIGTAGLSKSQKASFVSGLQSAVGSQNGSRKKESDGMVNFNAGETVKKSDFSGSRNVSLYKK